MSSSKPNAHKWPTVCVRLPDQATSESVVRAWLSESLAMPLADIHFERDDQGRPLLQPPLAHLDCNWSHSGGYLLASYVEHARVGVDIERVQTRRRADDIAQRYFTPSEQAWLAQLEGDEKALAFHRLWCCKEAILKAHGRGIAFGLDRLELLPDAEQNLQLNALDPALGHINAWSIQTWAPKAGYIAALAVKGG